MLSYAVCMQRDCRTNPPLSKRDTSKGAVAKGKRKSDLHENARAICTRNSKQVMKIGPREKRFCFSRGPIFCMIFCKAICSSLLFLFHAIFLRADGFRFTRFSHGPIVFVSCCFPTGRSFFSHDFPAERFFFYPVSAERSFLFCSMSRRPPRFWRQTSSSLSKRPERTAWGRPLHPRCTAPVPARVGA